MKTLEKIQCFLSDHSLNDVSESSDLTKKSNFDFTELGNNFADIDEKIQEQGHLADYKAKNNCDRAAFERDLRL